MPPSWENLSQTRFFQALLRPIGGGQRTGSTDTAPIDFVKTSKFVKSPIERNHNFIMISEYHTLELKKKTNQSHKK